MGEEHVTAESVIHNAEKKTAYVGLFRLFSTLPLIVTHALLM